jgi:hypothetical protein
MEKLHRFWGESRAALLRGEGEGGAALVRAQHNAGGGGMAKERGQVNRLRF